MRQALPEIDRRYAGPRPRVSVVILTLNEQINIEACIASCSWCDDVHVLDSGSTDETVRIARSMGATVHVNPFKSFGQQRNWAIDNIKTKHDWCFHLDADERFTPSMVAEMDTAIKRESQHAGFLVANQLIFMHGWIKRSSGYPAYQLRLFHKERLRFADSGHGQKHQTTGSLGRLREPYVHHNFSKGVDEWFERHNRYSTKEAQDILASRAEPLGLLGLFGGVAERRQTLKRIFSRLPCRSMIRFWWTLVVGRGILDGMPGIQYARLIAIYEQLIALKVHESIRGSVNRPPLPGHSGDATASPSAGSIPGGSSTGTPPVQTPISRVG